MGAFPVQEYSSNMDMLLREYKSLDFDKRKKRFTEFVRREAEIFARAIDNAQIQNITSNDYNTMIYKRNEYLKQLFDSKDICSIF